MTLFRVNHNKNYTIINNTICKDNRLSWKAKGIFLYAFSRPDTWQFFLEDLIKQSTDGKDSVSAGLRELVEAGYLKRERIRKADGTFERGAIWDFFETPQELKEFVPETENPVLDNPVLEKPPLISTDPVISTEKNSNSAVVFFDCLKDLDIPIADKIAISATNPESRVKHAVAFATHPETKFTKGLVQCLKWACNEQPALPKGKGDIIQENKAYAQHLVNIIKPIQHVSFEALNASVEIHYIIGQMEPFVLSYHENAFKEQLHNGLRKFGYKVDNLK
jgi:hypothetical protein